MKTMKYLLTFVMTVTVMLLAASRAMAQTPIPITCGQTINGAITNATQLGIYSFNGTAGQVVRFVFQWQCATWGEMEIYYPGTTMPATNIVSACNGNALDLTLPSSGTYEFIVHSQGYNSTGSYQLTVQTITGGGCNPRPIACGQTVSSTISNPTQITPYSFVGSAGQVVRFVFQWQCATWGKMEIYYPGTTVPATNIVSACNGNALDLTLPSSGTYALFVHSASQTPGADYNETGNYQLTVQTVTGGGCNTTPIACGQTVSSNITYATQITPYGFGTGGGLVIFSFSGYGGAQFDLYDPMDNKLFTETPGTATNITLAAGTYTLLVHDTGYNGTGNYGFTVTCPFPVCNYLISPTGVSVGASATNGTVTVTTGSGCAWTATNNGSSWLRITSGSSGSGNGTVSYTVDANGSTSARAGTMTIAGFAFNVNQAGLPSLTDIDIGIPGAAGSLGAVTNAVYTVRGSGEGIFTTGDVFNFAYLPMLGDGMIVARLAGMQPDNPQSEAGVMMRDGLSGGARHVFLGLDASANMFLRRRLVANADSIENAGSCTNISWLRLTRRGNIFIGHVSTNGTSWNFAWATALVLPSQLEVGLAVTSHHYGYISTAQFDNLAIGAATPLPGAWQWPASRMYLCLDVATKAAMQNLGGFPVLVGGVVGDQFSVKGSTNAAASLASWQSLGTMTNTWGVVTFLDSQALTNRMRFYRAQRTGP